MKTARMILELAGGVFLLALVYSSGADEKASGREEGQFKIFVDGKEIGSEKYVLSAGEETVKTTSVMDFRNPGDTRQRIKLESTLEMDRRYHPKSYRLHTDLDGKRGTITGTFSPSTAMFEYAGGGASNKRGVLVGESFTILDTNIFHHFIFLARLFNFEKKDEMQKFEVVVPQEAESGFLKIKDLGTESIEVKGKKLETHHLRADSGALLIDFWVDASHALQKIFVPSLKIEVRRS